MSYARCLLLLACFFFSPATVFAQPPSLDPPFPVGVQRGTSLELTLMGSNLQEPLAVLASFPVKVTFPPEKNNGKEPGKLQVRLEVPPDVTIGWHSLRLLTKRGISNARLFCVDDLPQVYKAGTPHSFEQAQPVPAACVVCGKVVKEKADYYRITVRAGERLSFEVLGRRLGSQLDPQLRLYHGQTRKQLAFSDDARGQERDPRFSYVFAEAGTYFVEIRDARHREDKDWYYRLRIGPFPLTTVPMPLAVQRGSTRSVGFVGPSAGPLPEITVMAPTDPLLESLPLWPTSPPLFPQQPYGVASWPVLLALSDLPELLEVEPNDTPERAMPLLVPCAVSGGFHKPGDQDYYRFPARNGQRLSITLQTWELHAPADLQLSLRDAKGTQLAVTNPEANPSHLDFTAPADGDYTLKVEHLFYRGGPEEAYRLVLRPYAPGFTLTATTDRIDIPPGGSINFGIHVQRRGYDGPIEVMVQSPSVLQGKITIPAKQNTIQLPLTVRDKTPLGAYPFRILGQATIEGKLVTEQVDISGVWRQTLHQLPHPPRHLVHDLALGVFEKPKPTLAGKKMFGWPFR
jgi:hypothetical protein